MHTGGKQEGRAYIYSYIIVGIISILGINSKNRNRKYKFVVFMSPPPIKVVYSSPNLYFHIKWNIKKLREGRACDPPPLTHTHTQAQDDSTTEIHGTRTAHEK